MYNVITTIFNSINFKGNIVKTHNFYNNPQNLYIITMRHPYNSVISFSLLYNNEIDNKNIQESIIKYLQHGGKDMCDIDLNLPNIIIFKYEDFKDNIDYIFDILSKKLNIVITDEIKNEIKNKTNIENVINYTSQYKSFNEHCKITHLHGNHISKYKGNTNYKNYIDNVNNTDNISFENEDLSYLIKKFLY